ncbi:glycosyltransferase [Owenweeksia hongkongensis DSM 17368]|uniref:Glycosyltransferase n=1 Tax=Owenweeksia hongkongensis (strain DSM 17368 / CIP 108786 / JCM 12287 / NRRL B-23963 / UST20020801) TaxID=926562 RepID=G8R510_OWEHD|nr:glycosyltransferase [Owenweeksia hongkongensis]AEV34324.1 glycosyltransferase [Owenweeksia hongkongensis DSM 17368]
MNTSPHTPFLIVGLQPWDTTIGSNCKNIAVELAKRTKVLYINIPLDWNTVVKNSSDSQDHIEFRKNVRKGKTDSLVEVEENLYVFTPSSIILSINTLPPGRLFDYFNLRNNRKIAAEVKPILKKLNFQEFFLFNDNDMFRSYYMKELLKPLLSIYYSRDNLISTDYFKKHGTRIEPKLIEKSDLSVANSTFLRDYCRQYNPKSYYIGQGCDLSLFDPNKSYSKPQDMEGIANPIIGYIGFLTSMRLDITLLENLAESKKDWSFVLVGPEDSSFTGSRLHQMENVYFLGSKKPEELSTYLNFFDVSINPQLINDMTIGNYPRKVDEYLAMGKPVIATATKAMSVFAEHCYLATNASEYEILIDKALSENSRSKREARINFANEHTWDNSIDNLLSAIQKTINLKGKNN